MQISKHAQSRSQQRGIRNDIVDIIIEHGTPVNKPGSALEYRLTKKKRADLITSFKKMINKLERTSGIAVLTGTDGQIITVYHLQN